MCIILYFVSSLVQLNGNDNSPLLVEDDFDDGHYDEPFESYDSIILLILAVLSDLIVSFCITQLFISKLFRLLIMSISNRDNAIEASPEPAVELLDLPPPKMKTFGFVSRFESIDEAADSDSNTATTPKRDFDDMELNESIRKMSKSDKSVNVQKTKWSVHSFGAFRSRSATPMGSPMMMRKVRIKLDAKDNEMITTITRYTLLSTMTMVMTQIYFIIELAHILLITFDHKSNDVATYHRLDAPLAALSITDSLIAICSIYLNFSFSRRWYKRLCSVCHRGLQNVCKRMTEKKVIREKENNGDSDGYHLML